jgi:hypothetical protein
MTLVLLMASWLGIAPPDLDPVLGAEYRLDTKATYDVRPKDESAAVTIQVTFRNTTPNPPGRFSVFEVIDLAVHDGARRLRARDAKGALRATLDRRQGVTVASIRPRQGVRYRDTVRFTVSYALPDGASSDVRIRPSVVIFPVWSFGTSGRVEVKLPGDYEVLVDGDPLTASRRGGNLLLTSGRVDEPTRWLALLTATLPSSFATLSRSISLAAGELELQVRAWSDDRRWGRRTLDLMADAMPRLEGKIGLEYHSTGPLVIVESLPASGGELSEPTLDGTDVAIGFNEPAFTILHQLAHAWFSPALAEERWIREGFGSRAAAAVARELEVALPYGPLSEARDREADAFPLISWGAGESSADQDRYAYAASWAVADLLTRRVGADAMSLAWRRITGGLDGYQPIDQEPSPAGSGPFAAVDSRGLLDQLEAVSGEDLAEVFEEWVFDQATSDMLPARMLARERYTALEQLADDWGAPDPVRLAMAGWRFADAEAGITEATAWLEDRDALLNDIQAAGLTAPDRLRTEFQAGGGSQAARDELEAEAAVVAAYSEARGLQDASPSPVEQVGLLGGDQPDALLDEARTSFAEGDLVGANAAATEARDRLRNAGQDGLVRIASAIVVGVLLSMLAIAQVRRRGRVRSSGYTARP